MEQREDNVITFSLVWGVIKKSFVRAVIYVLVSVILAAALLFVCRTFTKTSVYGATITFKQADKNAKATLDDYKATAISNAIHKNLPNIINEEFTNIYNEFYGSLIVSPVIPEDLEAGKEEEYIAVIYKLSQKDLQSVSSDEQVAILQDIANELVERYSTLYAANLVDMATFGFIVAEEGKYKEEYFEVVNELRNNIRRFAKTIAAMAQADKTFYNFRGTSEATKGITVQELVAGLETIQLRTDKIKNTIKATGISNMNAKLNGQKYCDDKLMELNAESTMLVESIAKYDNAIEAMGKMFENNLVGGGSTGTGGTVVVEIQAYNDLLATRQSLHEDKAEVDLEIQRINDYASAISANVADNVEIEREIALTVEDVEEILVSYNALVADYNRTYVPSGYASVSKSAHQAKVSLISFTLLIVAVVAVGVVAYVVAFGQTWSSLKKAGNLNEKYLHTPQKKQPKEKAE